MNLVPANSRRCVRPGIVGVAMICLSSLLGGCASGAKSRAMIPVNLAINNHHPGTVAAEVKGGRKTNPMLASQISDPNFQEALQQAIRETHVFSEVVQGTGGDYHLRVELLDLDQPGMGFNMTVRLTTQWQLTRMQDGKRVLDHRVQGKYTATMGDSMVGMTRIRYANEGAARDSIRQGLLKISELEL